MTSPAAAPRRTYRRVRIARDHARGRGGFRTPSAHGGENVVAPESVHFSVHEAADLLDLELRTVPAVDLDGLTAAVDADTVRVVAVAGTTACGRVDPVPAVAEVAADVGRSATSTPLGWARGPFTDHVRNFDDATVDTMTLDPHKLGPAAIPAGGLFVRDGSVASRRRRRDAVHWTAASAVAAGHRSGAGVASAAAAPDRLWPDGYRCRQRRIGATVDWLADELRERGYDVVDPEPSLLVVDLDREVVETLQAEGWRLATTAADELRVVRGPHLTRSVLRSFRADSDRVDAGDGE